MEIEHSIKDSAKTDCPACKAIDSLQRLISGKDIPFILKGDGWYKDGYETKNNNATTKGKDQ